MKREREKVSENGQHFSGEAAPHRNPSQLPRRSVVVSANVQGLGQG
jgi:hypothetical protein